jgi:hypothetical protein
VFLKYSLPGWLRILARGAKLVYGGFTLVVLGIVCGFVGVIFLASMMPRPMPGAGAIVLVCAGLCIFGGGCMAIIGWWLLTRRDPSGLGEDQYGKARQVIRITLLIWIGDLALQILGSRSTIPVPVHQAIVGVDIATSVAFAIGLGAQLRYVEKLAARLPDEKFGKRAASIKTSFPVCYALMSGWSKYAGNAFTTTNFAMVFGCSAGVATLGALGCFVIYVRLLRDLGRRLALEASISATMWDPDVLSALVRK